MPVLLIPDPSTDTVTVNMTVLVGSRHEGYGEAGMAHLLEHMLFKGTPSHPDIPKVLQDRGATFNGTTWLDRTNYYETLPADGDNLEFAIRLEADRLINSYIRGEDLASEFRVVRSEFEQGEDSPQRILLQRIQSAAYDWHNYGRSTIGNRSDIERVPIVNLRAFYRKHYQVDNIVVAIAGKFDPNEALQLMQKHFGAIAKPKRPKDKTYTIEPTQDGERTIVVRRVGDVPLVGVAYHIPPVAHEDFAVVSVLSNILGTEPSGRLYKELVETEKASSAFTMNFDTHDPGLAFAGAELPRGGNVEEARRSLIEAIEKIGAMGVTEEELARAKAEMAQGFERESASSRAVALSLSEWAARGDWRLRYLNRDRVEQVTLQQAKNAAAKYFIRTNRTVGLFIPTSKDEGEPRRATIPPQPALAELLDGYTGRKSVEAGEQFAPTWENIARRLVRYESASGVKVALLPKKSRGSLVRVQVSVRYGNEKALQGLVAAADLLPSLMVRGTRNLTFQQLDDELTKNRARINGGGTTGLLSVSIETKREHLAPMLDILHDVLRHPSLPADQLELVRRPRLTRLETRQTDPMALAINRWRRLLSPREATHIWYVPTIAESLERLRSVKLEDIQKLHADFLSNQAVEVVVVGDYDESLVRQWVDRLAENWTSQIKFSRVPDPAAAGVEGRSETILTPDKKNAIYLAGLRFPMTDADPDYPALVIGNFAFGGGMLSNRLAERVRQDEGLSYGVGSMVNAHPIDQRGQFAMQAGVNPESRDKLVNVIAEELERLVADGITEEELQRAKDGFLLSAKKNRTSRQRAGGHSVQPAVHRP